MKKSLIANTGISLVGFSLVGFSSASSAIVELGGGATKVLRAMLRLQVTPGAGHQLRSENFDD
jgi:hypothetical protein